MPLAKNVMQGGTSAGQARAINGNNVNATVTAAGTTQGTATAIGADLNVVTTATAAQGVILYAGVPGDDQWVHNAVVSASIVVYPPTGSKINQIATNGGMTLAPNTGVLCKTISATQILAILSA